jgi:hypothetical protein
VDKTPGGLPAYMAELFPATGKSPATPVRAGKQALRVRGSDGDYKNRSAPATLSQNFAFSSAVSLSKLENPP